MIETTEALIGVWGSNRVGVKLSLSNRHNGMFDSSSRESFGYLISALEALKVGYLHLMEPDASDLKSGTVQVAHVAETFRPLISVPLISNGGFNQRTAQQALDDGRADFVSFGKLFLANPDLPERMRRGAPFNAPVSATFYGEGPKGYTDYPVLSKASHA